MSKDGFTLRYLTQTAVGVPRDLANSLVISKLKAIRPTVLIYNKSKVTSPPASYEVLIDPKNK